MKQLKTRSKRKNTSFRLTEQLLKKLRDTSVKTGVSANHLVEMAMREYLLMPEVATK